MYIERYFCDASGRRSCLDQRSGVNYLKTSHQNEIGFTLIVLTRRSRRESFVMRLLDGCLLDHSHSKNSMTSLASPKCHDHQLSYPRCDSSVVLHNRPYCHIQCIRIYCLSPILLSTSNVEVLSCP